jgi:acetyl-CoA acetyltransferase
LGSNSFDVCPQLTEKCYKILAFDRFYCVVATETVPVRTVNRQCSSGLQAVADVVAAIKAGFYDIGIGGGLESMSSNPMAWEGSVNPRVSYLASPSSLFYLYIINIM